jgi:hypothetical protein
MARRKQQLSTRQSIHKMLWVEPLHVVMDPLAIPVENMRISQQFTPKYNQQDAYGRMDPIATFQKTSRQLRINFDCAAHHALDGPLGVVNNLRNINILTQLLYPTYKKLDDSPVPAAILKSPPFFRITYGNYFGSFIPTGDLLGTTSGLTGFISSFGHDIGEVAKNVAFGTANLFLTEEEKTPQHEIGFRALPRQIRVNMSFVVVHDKLVGWYDNEFSPGGYGENFPYNAGNFTSGESGGSMFGAPGGKGGAAGGDAGIQEEKVEEVSTTEKTPGNTGGQGSVKAADGAKADSVLEGEG